MFDNFIPGNRTNKEEEMQIRAEKRQQTFARESQYLEAASTDDPTYIDQQERKTDLLRWQQDLDDELYSLISLLLGKRKTSEGWEEISQPLCNEKFITDVVIPHAKPYMARSLINTNWNEKTILFSLKKTMNTIADAMADGWDEYDIKFTKWDNVLSNVKITCKAGAFRSLNGWTKRVDSTMIKRIESLSEQNSQPQQKKGLIGIFKGA
jgi:hypothetical protein